MNTSLSGFRTWLKHPRSIRTLIKGSMLTIIATLIVSVGILASYPEAVDANSLVVFDHPTHHVASTQQGQATSQGAPQAATPKASSSLCTPDGANATPTAPDNNPDQPGLHQSNTATNSYTVYGDSIDAITAQMARCTPSTNGSDRFAASTDYAINWSFRYQGNDSGVCTITSVSVGLSIVQTYPTWQAQATNPALASAWKTFISNLTTHENGHSKLDQAAAAAILSDLQNFPPSDCATIEARANAQANTQLAALNQANDAYDANTNHGVSQGAVLR